MKTMHELVTRKQWFVLFNAACVIASVATGRLTPTWDSVVINLLVLGLMNGIAAISARNFPDWK
jgi:hypothetical protein